MIPILQLESLAVTTVTFILSIVLTVFLTRSYFKAKRSSLLFWSLGMWAFTIGVLLEVIFALGIQPTILVSAYLFAVALLVELLAMGSMQLIESRKAKLAYSIFCIASTLLLVYSFAVSNVTNIIMNYVAYGNPPLLVIYASSIITFPAAAILIIIAAMSYLKKRDYRNISIIIGVIEVSIAGTLYIVSFPSLLYIAEFIGILLLWIGFFRGKPKAKG